MITRRVFNKSAAAAATTMAVDGLAQGATRQQRVGMAPVGLGSIAEVFMRAVSKTSNLQLTGFVTGHPVEKGKVLAAKYGVPESSIYTYETFQQIEHNSAIDAVCIALPNTTHCDCTFQNSVVDCPVSHC